MTQLAYIEHHSQTGDRWDLLAARYYGDAMRYEEIVRANPELMITPQIPSGRVVRIPVLAPAEPDTSDLPPWKR